MDTVNETTLLRLYCLATAVLLSEKHIESELVAQIIAADEQINEPDPDASVETRTAYKVFWRRLHEQVEGVAKAHNLAS